MKRLAIVFAVPLLLSAGIAFAQRPVPAGQTGLAASVSPGELKVTPEMWFYDQAMRVYKDPKMQVRERGVPHRATHPAAGIHAVVRLLQ